MVSKAYHAGCTNLDKCGLKAKLKYYQTAQLLKQVGTDLTRNFDIKNKYNLNEFGRTVDNGEIRYQIDVLKSGDSSRWDY